MREVDTTTRYSIGGKECGVAVGSSCLSQAGCGHAGDYMCLRLSWAGLHWEGVHEEHYHFPRCPVKVAKKTASEVAKTIGTK